MTQCTIAAKKNVACTQHFFDVDSMADEEVVPLIEVVDGKYAPCATTLAWLTTITKHVCVTTCVGKYRTGKSFLLNSLSQTSAFKGFLVGNTVQACTKGLWIMRTPLFEDDSKCILLMDTEGIDSLDAQDDHDVHVFTLALLLSSVFCYNSVGTIDEASLQTLSLVTNICNRLKESEACTMGELSQRLPHCVWLLRDFGLQLKLRDGRDCTADEYMEEALRDATSCGDDRTRVRDVIRDAFPNRALVPFPHPSINSKQNLTAGSSNDAFKRTMESLRSRIVEQPVYMMADQTRMSGSMYAQTVQHTCEALNTSGAIPPMKDTWSLLADSQASDLLRQSCEVLRKRARELTRDATGTLRLATAVGVLVDECTAKFRKGLMMPNATAEAEMRREVRGGGGERVHVRPRRTRGRANPVARR